MQTFLKLGVMHTVQLGELAGISAAQERAGHQAVRKLHCAFLILCIPFITIIVIFLFLCCSVKLYPKPRVLPFSSSSPLHPTRGEKWEHNCVVLCCWLGLNEDTTTERRMFSWVVFLWRDLLIQTAASFTVALWIISPSNNLKVIQSLKRGLQTVREGWYNEKVMP